MAGGLLAKGGVERCSHPINPAPAIHSTRETLLLVLALTAAARAQYCPHYDTVYYNGNILTGRSLNTSTPERVSAIVITQGKIAVTGTDAMVVDPRSCTTFGSKIDLHGAFVVPGFNDAHTHIAFAGQQHLTLDLDNVPSLAAMQQKIKAYAATLPPGAWITGGGWDHTKWPDKDGKPAPLPTRGDIDLFSGNHPTYLERTDGHIALVNSTTLQLGDITAKTMLPLGSKIDLDDHFVPTGIIREAGALALIQKLIPKPDQATRRKALQLSIADAVSHGVTSLQDFSDWDDFIALESLESDDLLFIRISEWLTFNDPISLLKAHQNSHPQDDPYLHTGMLKGFMDGSLGSRNASLVAPYSDDPGNSGLARYDQKDLNEMTLDRAESGFQIGFHAIGDRANSMALTALGLAEKTIIAKSESSQPNLKSAKVFEQQMSKDFRFRIEHAQVLAPADFTRFANLHIIASMQPSHLLTDMAWAGDRLGPDRVKYAYAWKSFLNQKVTLAFGTDYPVESIDPFRGLYAAVTRMNEAGTQTFQPQERLTLNEALYAYTQGSAFAENAETSKGQLATGFWADFVVLDRDITKATPQELLHTRVLRTIVAGKTVYIAPPTPTAELPHHNKADGDE